MMVNWSTPIKINLLPDLTLKCTKMVHILKDMCKRPGIDLTVLLNCEQLILNIIQSRTYPK